MDKITSASFVASGYEVYPSHNGGFVVVRRRGWPDMDRVKTREEIASFTNRIDLFAWLLSAHEAFDKEAA